MPAARLLALASLAALLAGCSSTRQIRTAPPRPAVSAPSDTTAADLARLAVVVEPGATALPEGVAALRFRVSEVHIKPADGAWTRLSADPNNLQIPAARRLHRPVLSTRLPAAAYDSLALVLDDVFVQYDANTGGPLTLPRGAPLRLPLALDLTDAGMATLVLRFEPGASLSHDARCRWYFLPFFDLAVE